MTPETALKVISDPAFRQKLQEGRIVPMDNTDESGASFGEFLRGFSGSNEEIADRFANVMILAQLFVAADYAYAGGLDGRFAQGVEEMKPVFAAWVEAHPELLKAEDEDKLGKLLAFFSALNRIPL